MLEFDGVDGMIERIQKRHLCLHWKAMNTFTSCLIAGKFDVFWVVPDNVSFVGKMLYEQFPWKLIRRKLDIHRA